MYLTTPLPLPGFSVGSKIRALHGYYRPAARQAKHTHFIDHFKEEARILMEYIMQCSHPLIATVVGPHPLTTTVGGPHPPTATVGDHTHSLPLWGDHTHPLPLWGTTPTHYHCGGTTPTHYHCGGYTQSTYIYMYMFSTRVHFKELCVFDPTNCSMALHST